MNRLQAREYRVKVRWDILLAWDGALPLLVASMPALLRFIATENEVPGLAALIFGPIVAALIRAAVGMTQLRRLGNTDVPRWRQAALGIAISLLLMFEGFVGLLSVAEDEPVATWIVAGLLYVAYLSSAIIAFATYQTKYYNGPVSSAD